VIQPVLMKALADLRRHRLQNLVIFLVTALAAGVGAMGATLLVQSSSPFDRAFKDLSGPHLVVDFDGSRVTRKQVTQTGSLSGVTASSGPWFVAGVPFEASSTGMKFGLKMLGRDTPGGQIDRERIVAGRWLDGPGEIVVTRAAANNFGLSIGARLTALGRAEKPVLTLVGEAVDIDPNPGRGWVSTSQVSSLNPAGVRLGYQMAYRFSSAATREQLRADLMAIEAALPDGSVTNAASYLEFRSSVNFTSSLILTFLLAFAAMGLAAVAVIVANIVTGAVLVRYREIGILKAIGFTPRQVVFNFITEMTLPALVAGLLAVPLGALASTPLLDQEAVILGLPAGSPFAPGVDLLVLVVAIAVVVMAAALPASRASHLHAATAITTGAAPSSRWSASPLFDRLQWWALPRWLLLGVGQAFSRPLRGGLTAIAILVGVATLVFASGLHASISKFNDLFGPAINGPYQVSVSRFGDYSDRATLSLLDTQPETSLVVGMEETSISIAGEPDPIATTVFKGGSARLGYRMAAGRWFSSAGEAVLGVTFNPFHWRIGQTVLTNILGVSTPLRIVGSCYCFFNLATDWSTYNLSTDAQPPTFYLVQLRPGADAKAYARRVAAAEPDFLDAQVNRQGTSSPGSGIDVEGALNTIVVTLAVILGLIAGIGVFNAMLLNGRERVRDISILKALGMTPGQVSLMVVSTASALAVLGVIVGIPAGFFLYRQGLQALATVAGFTLSGSAIQGSLNTVQIAGVALGGILIAAIGALLPARWAARVPVVAVLNIE
jgi:putative ABC transport system permease protein